MAKKGKAKNGAAPSEGGQEVGTPAAAASSADPVRLVAEKSTKEEAPKQAKEKKVPTPVAEKKNNQPKAPNAEQTTTVAENNAEGETAELKRKNSRRNRNKKAGDGEGADSQQPKEADSGTLFNQKKRLRKKRSKLARALELAESNTNAQKAALEVAATGENALSAEELRKRLEVVENLLKHVQAKTQEEQKKVESMKGGLESKHEEKKEQKNRKESESSSKNLTSEKARKEADVKKLSNEKAQMQNEAKRLVDEKARKELEMKKLIEEKAKKDAEAKALLEEKAARDAELARLTKAKVRVETVEQKINEIDQKVQQRKETDEVKVAPGSPKQKKEQARTRKDSESNKKKEAEEKPKKETEEKTKKEAAEKAKKEAEEKAKKEGAEKAKKEAEDKTKKEAAEKAKKEAEEKVKKDAAEKAKKESEEKAKKEAEEKAKKEAAEKAKKEAEDKAKKEAAEKAKKEAEEKTKKEAAEKAKKEAEEKAKKEAAEKAKKEAEEKAKKDAAEKAKKEAEEKTKKEAVEKAKKEAEEKAKKEATEKAKKEAEEKAKKEAVEKAKKEAEEKAKKDAAEKAKKEAEEKAKKEAAEKAKKEAEEKAKKEAAEKAKKEAEEKAKKEAAEKAKKETEEKTKKEAEEKSKREAEEKVKLQSEEKLKQEALEKAKKLAELEDAKRKSSGEQAKHHQNGSAAPTPTQDKPAAQKQDAKNNKKNNKRTPKNSVSEDEKSTTKASGSKNGQSGDFASSAETVPVAKSHELQSAPVPPKTPEVAPAVPKAAQKPSNGKPAASTAAAPANGKQQTPPAKTSEKAQPPKTAARSSPPKTTAKAPSPPKTVPVSKPAPKPSTPPASKKPDPPPKPEFLKKKSPEIEKEKLQASKAPAVQTSPAVPTPQVPAATPVPSAVSAPPTQAAVSAPAPAAVPNPAPVSDPAVAAAARLAEEALNGTKKPATTPAAAAGGANSKPKPVQKKPEVPPKPDVHSKSAAKMKTPIKQPSGKASTVTITHRPVQNNHLTTIQSDCRSPATELSRTEAFKKNMDIISTIADVLLSYPRSKRNRADAANANESSKSTFDPSSISLQSSAPSASLFSSLFPSLSSGPSGADPSASNQPTNTNVSPTSAESGSADAKASKQRSKIDLERILRILQSTQSASRPLTGSTEAGNASKLVPATGSDPAASQQQPSMDSTENPFGSFLTKDAIRMLMPTLQEVNVKFNVEKQLEALNATAAMAKLLPKTLPPGTDTTEEDEFEEDLLDEEADDTIEYKFTPRPVFIATICQVCKNPVKTFFHCELCRMVSYCGEDHRRIDQPPHRDLCAVLCEIASKRGGHIYHMARKLNVQEYRNLRVHTLNQIELTLKRPLQAFEREIVLFPRICLAPDCREWKQELLIECKDCRQVSYCANQPTHLLASHGRWCKAYFLFQKLILRQRILGRIEPVLPVRILSKPTPLAANVDETFKQLYKNSSALRDECVYAVLSQIATAPLTALHAYQQAGLPFGSTFTIHLVGAELQFEGDTLDKWEAFFLHLVPEVAVLRVVFVGPELNVENLPIDVISRIRMCRTCRMKCRVVAFDFQCRTMYHDYRQSSRYQRPDLICFFNPGLHRVTGYAGLDSWPQTIRTATEAGCPMVVTAYTELESPLDLERLQRESTRALKVTQAPSVNPFGSKRPDRNFISDETAPMIFKNYFYFLVQ